MTDDIVTRLQMFSLDDGTDALNKLLAEAADEIERLRRMLSELANRFSAQEAKHYRIIRQLEVERDQWQQQAVNRG